MLRRDHIERMLAAISSPSSEVQRYTSAADKKRLAATGLAKMTQGGQTGNAEVTNTQAPLHKQAKKPA